MNKFTWYRLDKYSNIFLIIPKESEGYPLPLIVHGILKVQGKGYIESSCERQAISEELITSGEIWELVDQVETEYFKVD